MRFVPTTCVLVLAVLAAATTLVAHAGTVFTFTPDAGPLSYNFEVNSGNPTIGLPGNSVAFYNVPITFDLGLHYTGAVGFFNANTAPNAPFVAAGVDGYDFILLAPDNTTGFIYLGPQLYSGSELSPEFLYGSYHLTGVSGQPDGTLVISNTPEPSSLILLGTGTLGMLGVARRKLRAV